MAVTPYNLKKGSAVIVNQNGTWANSWKEATAKARKTVNKVIKQYNKGAKVGVLTGIAFELSLNGKIVNMVEVLLTNPIKPNWTTTHYKVVFRADNLDVLPETIKPNLPAKVVQKAQTKAKASGTVSTSTTANTPSGTNESDYYDYVPQSETSTGVNLCIGLVVLAVVTFIGVSVYRKIKKKP